MTLSLDEASQSLASLGTQLEEWPMAISRADPPASQIRSDSTTLLGVDEARSIVLAAFHPLAPIATPVLDALGSVAAAPVVAIEALPPFDNSAMDGFAVRASDTAGATRSDFIQLRIIGSAPAGYPNLHHVEPGTAVRIMTGAPMPAGADAVVRFEETDELEADQRSTRPVIGIYRAARSGENVRPTGEDVAPGQVVLTEGSRIRAAEIAMLSALGFESISVHRRPLVAILSTGDEVVDARRALRPGEIRNSNSNLIAALTMRSGGIPFILGVARDSTSELTAKLEQARKADVIITTGGVSAGDYDFVKDVLRSRGEIEIWQVRLKPGKPLAFGRVGGVPLLGLPGNPVAAAVAFEQFARPAIRKMMGHLRFDIPTVEATMLNSIENRGGRRNFVRVRVERRGDGSYSARLAGSQGAGMLSSLLLANGLLVIPENVEAAEPGMRFTVQMLDWEMD